MTPATARGKVVLMRFWTDGCHYCASTLPQLEKLQSKYGRDGLVVLGVYHPKPAPRRVSDREVLSTAKRLGFSGPLALDQDWKTLNRYWLDGDPDRAWTSVSFLIDRESVIRWVHGGGEYHESDDPMHRRCVLEYEGLEAALTEALGKKSAGVER
jgi:thiol-disulfide isomerase/thioredoxin